jgi:hypothetical protein
MPVLVQCSEIDLDNDEAPPSLAPGQGLVSASRTLMELKAVEKQRSEYVLHCNHECNVALTH